VEKHAEKLTDLMIEAAHRVDSESWVAESDVSPANRRMHQQSLRLRTHTLLVRVHLVDLAANLLNRTT
jgi:hypothetical protein